MANIEKEYNELTHEERELLHKYFYKINEDQFKEHYDKLKKIIFKVKPPSAKEFLDYRNGYISYHTEKNIYEYIKNDFINIIDNKVNPYSVVSLYGSIRTGKSTLVRLLILYVIVYVNYIRDPHLYFKINDMNKITIYLLSFKDDKTNELLLDPILKMIRNSDKFKKETFEENVYKNGVAENGVISYSTASKFGALTFPNCSVVTGRDPSDLIGGDIIVGAITEITFYRSYIGLTDDEVTDVYTKLKTRIRNTIGENIFPCFTILDSSAFNADSEIEKIIKRLSIDPKCYYAYYRLWEVRPYLYPSYNKNRNDTFKICTGNATYPSKIIRDNHELKEIPNELIVDVPNELRESFETKLIDNIRDLAGVGTSNTSKLFPSTKVIDSIFDNPTIENYNLRIIADSKENSKGLIWKQLDIYKLFNETLDGKFEIKRANKEPRFIGLDLSYSNNGDDTGLTVLHKEYSRNKNSIVYVSDFNLIIGSGENKINMDSISEFIIELSQLGNLNILGITVDTFQSESLVQKLETYRFNIEKNSVDKTSEPYELLVALSLQGLVKSGYHTYLYNNLNSLYRDESKTGKPKVDHSKSRQSIEGKDAKDLSDSLTQGIWISNKIPSYPITIYEDENERLNNIKTEKLNDNTVKKLLNRFKVLV